MKVLDLTSINVFLIPYVIVMSLEGAGSRWRSLVFPDRHTHGRQVGIIACLQAMRCLQKSLISQSFKNSAGTQAMASVSPELLLGRCFFFWKIFEKILSNFALVNYMQLTSSLVEYDLKKKKKKKTHMSVKISVHGNVFLQHTLYESIQISSTCKYILWSLYQTVHKTVFNSFWNLGWFKEAESSM